MSSTVTLDLSPLSDETLIYIFNRCTDGISTNGPVKDGGFTTASSIIEEMAIRRKLAELDLARFKDQEAVFCKLMSYAHSANRSAHGRTPKTEKSISEAMGWSYESGPENVAEIAKFLSGGKEKPTAEENRKRMREVAQSRTEAFARHEHRHTDGAEET